MFCLFVLQNLISAALEDSGYLQEVGSIDHVIIWPTSQRGLQLRIEMIINLLVSTH